ncbi:hypothetical protein FRX31_030254 [Thalictrum thalictroides]|uniref:SKP1 component dimerisation domain-containing protein n=1 Tax=Thalictrum thalictroides TaxID=46969 RepID=A0A7J6V640_THATH|nr:hypothetical protein FRX31_030254 [Thalictrum thalictroides]
MAIIKLTANNGDVVEANSEDLQSSLVIKAKIAKGEENIEIKFSELKDINEKVLNAVISFCKMHNIQRNKTILEGFYERFIADHDKTTLSAIVSIGHYLNISSLIDFGCDYTSRMMKGKSMEEIIEGFGLTPESCTPTDVDVHWGV